MTATAFAVVGLTIVLSMLVGAYIALAVKGEDASAIAAAGAAAGAFLAGLVTAEVVRSRRN